MSWDDFTTCFKERSMLGLQYMSEDGSTNKPKDFNLQVNGQKGRGNYDKYRKPHDGACRSRGIGYENCSKTCHVSRGCP